MSPPLPECLRACLDFEGVPADQLAIIFVQEALFLHQVGKRLRPSFVGVLEKAKEKINSMHPDHYRAARRAINGEFDTHDNLRRRK